MTAPVILQPTAAPSRNRKGSRRSRLPVGWPLAGLLVLYPVWWMLGIGPFLIVGFAIPMAWQLRKMRPLRLPPGFALWALLLVLVLVSGVMLGVDAPNALTSTGAGRYFAYALRFGTYLAVLIVLLYIGNISGRVLPSIRVIRWMGVLFLTTVVGGFLGMIFPTVSISSPMKYIIPSGLANSDFLAGTLTASFSQTQDIVGSTLPRPSAPFDFANAWGNNLSLSLIWFVVGFWVYGSRRQRKWAPVLLAASVVPLVFSLNRGVWMGLAVAGLYVAVRLAMKGNWKVLIGAAAAVAVAVPLILVSPMGSLIEARTENPHSNTIRSSLAQQSVNLAMSSPVLGYGSTRNTIGSERSLAIGQSPECPRCGNRVIGSTGQVWLLLVSQGFLGAMLYASFFGYSLWRYRRDATPIGIAGSAVIVLTLYYMFFYTAVGPPLALAMISIGLLWRNELSRRKPALGAAA